MYQNIGSSASGAATGFLFFAILFAVVFIAVLAILAPYFLWRIHEHTKRLVASVDSLVAHLAGPPKAASAPEPELVVANRVEAATPEPAPAPTSTRPGLYLCPHCHRRVPKQEIVQAGTEWICRDCGNTVMRRDRFLLCVMAP